MPLSDKRCECEVAKPRPLPSLGAAPKAFFLFSKSFDMSFKLFSTFSAAAWWANHWL